jgi:hypothetical protein
MPVPAVSASQASDATRFHSVDHHSAVNNQHFILLVCKIPSQTEISLDGEEDVLHLNVLLNSGKRKLFPEGFVLTNQLFDML